MNKSIVFSVFLMMVCVTAFSCAHGSKMRKLYPGMTKQEVLKTLGKPDGYQKAGEYEAFKYANKLMSGWSWDRADYYAILKEGVLVEYGAGNIRVKDSNIIILVPLR
jgi:hypothetical protein